MCYSNRLEYTCIIQFDNGYLLCAHGRVARLSLHWYCGPNRDRKGLIIESEYGRVKWPVWSSVLVAFVPRGHSNCVYLFVARPSALWEIRWPRGSPRPIFRMCPAITTLRFLCIMWGVPPTLLHRAVYYIRWHSVLDPKWIRPWSHADARGMCLESPVNKHPIQKLSPYKSADNTVRLKYADIQRQFWFEFTSYECDYLAPLWDSPDLLR